MCSAPEGEPNNETWLRSPKSLGEVAAEVCVATQVQGVMGSR